MSNLTEVRNKISLIINIPLMRKTKNIKSYDEFINCMNLPVSHESHFFYMCYCGLVDDVKKFVENNLLINNDMYSKGILYSIKTSSTDVIEYLLSLNNYAFVNRINWKILSKTCTSSFLFKLLINAPNHLWIENMILDSLNKQSSRNKFKKNLDYCANDILQYYISNNYFHGFHLLRKYNLAVVTQNAVSLANELPTDSKIKYYFESQNLI
jgi:hypothetical protein